MMPRLQAEEALHTVETVMIGTGSFKEEHLHEVRQTMERWRRAKDSTGERVKPVKADPNTLAALGIGIRFVPVTPKSPTPPTND